MNDILLFPFDERLEIETECPNCHAKVVAGMREPNDTQSKITCPECSHLWKHNPYPVLAKIRDAWREAEAGHIEINFRFSLREPEHMEPILIRETLEPATTAKADAART